MTNRQSRAKARAGSALDTLYPQAAAAALDRHQPAAQQHRLDPHGRIGQAEVGALAGFRLLPDLSVVEPEYRLAEPARQLTVDMRVDGFAFLLLRVELDRFAPGDRRAGRQAVDAQPVVERLELVRRQLAQAGGVELGLLHAFLERGELGRMGGAQASQYEAQYDGPALVHRITLKLRRRRERRLIARIVTSVGRRSCRGGGLDKTLSECNE